MTNWTTGPREEGSLERALRDEALLARPEPPAELSARIRASLAEVEPQSGPHTDTRSGASRTLRWFAVAATVALLLVPFFVPAEPRQAPPARPSNLSSLGLGLAQILGANIAEDDLVQRMDEPLAAEGRLLLADASRATGALESFFAPLARLGGR